MKIIHRWLILSLFALFAMASGACSSLQPLQVYVREGGSYIYFIKPMRFNGATRSEWMQVDWTIHASHDSIQEVVMNLSVFAPRPVRAIDSVRITGEAYRGSWLLGAECFFIEPCAKGFQSRYSITFPSLEVVPLLLSQKLQIELRSERESMYEGTRRSWKVLKALRGKLLPLLPR